MPTKKTRPEHVETVDPATTPGVVDLSDADSPLVTVGEPEPTIQPPNLIWNIPDSGIFQIAAYITLPDDQADQVHDIMAAVEKAIHENVAVERVEMIENVQPAEVIPPGHSARTIILSDEQWSAVDRQATRNKSTGSQWLRRFLQPYLRRG